MATKRNYCKGKCNKDARIDGRCMACGLDLSPAGYSTTECTTLARHDSRSGRHSIRVSAAHTVRNTRWMVTVTEKATNKSETREFTNVDLQTAKDYANERWAD